MNKIAKRTAVCATIWLVSLSAMDANAAPRTHDGFYLGLDAGLGYLSTSASYRGIDEKISGVTLDSALWLGGTVGPVVEPWPARAPDLCPIVYERRGVQHVCVLGRCGLQIPLRHRQRTAQKRAFRARRATTAEAALTVRHAAGSV